MDRNISFTVRAKKSFGQNFLTSDGVVAQLLSAADVDRQDTVLEIGPGLGKVTTLLAARAKKVIAVEIDRDLIPTLSGNLKTFNNVEIINDDILNYLRYHVLIHDNVESKIVASLPYQVTSPLLHQLMSVTGWTVAALLIQKEVAEKIVALPPKANYLSNFVQYFADVKLIAAISKTNFFPVPEVDGAIIRLEKITKPDGFAEQSLRVDPKSWAAFLHRGFSHPRQMINKAFPPSLLTEVGVDPQRRPATVTIAEWLRLYKMFR